MPRFGLPIQSDSHYMAPVGQSGGEWSRLATLLLHRRVQLGFPNRARFVRDRDLTQSQARVLLDMERGNRRNFSDATKAVMEQAYKWTPGSIDAVLAGGDPTPVQPIKVQELSTSAGVRVVAAGIETLTDPDEVRATIEIAHQRLAEIEGMSGDDTP